MKLLMEESSQQEFRRSEKDHFFSNFNELMYNKTKAAHRVLRLQLTYLKNPRTVKHAFFGVKPHGEQGLLKAFCPLWENPANLFEKKTIWVTK